MIGDICHYRLHRYTDLRIIGIFLCNGNFGAVKGYGRRYIVHTFLILI